MNLSKIYKVTTVYSFLEHKLKKTSIFIIGIRQRKKEN